ncbi:MAG TPA: hypothetical protein VGI32_10215 [Steroidobacteraceae bacterium]|jgi:hypothetical protein
MSGVPIALVHALVSESLAAWGVAGQAEPAGDCAVIVAGKKQIGIERAPANSMFRWLVTIDGRTRPALSLLAVLRQVREALDPSYSGSRLRIAIAPLVP